MRIWEQIEIGLFRSQKSKAMIAMIFLPMIILIAVWIYTVCSRYGNITFDGNVHASYCIYDGFLYYLARVGTVISFIFVIIPSLGAYQEKINNGKFITDTLPGTRNEKTAAFFCQYVIVALLSLFFMLFALFASICITSIALPKLDLPYYDCRIKFAELGIRMIISMLCIVLLQLLLHKVMNSVYLPLLIGLLCVLILSNTTLDPFWNSYNYFIDNIPFP
jgi:hypothetical protein